MSDERSLVSSVIKDVENAAWVFSTHSQHFPSTAFSAILIAEMALTKRYLGSFSAYGAVFLAHIGELRVEFRSILPMVHSQSHMPERCLLTHFRRCYHFPSLPR